MTEQDRRNEIKLLTEKQRKLIEDVVRLETEVAELKNQIRILEARAND